MKPSEFLRQVRKVMSPETWTKGALARDKDGKITAYDSTTACKFCLYGYFWYTRSKIFCDGPYELFHLQAKTVDFYSDILPLIESANKDVSGLRLSDFNDDLGTTFEDIVRVIDNTINYAEARGL